MEPKDSQTPPDARAPHRVFGLGHVVDDLPAELVELLDAEKSAAPEPSRNECIGRTLTIPGVAIGTAAPGARCPAPGAVPLRNGFAMNAS